MEFPDGMDTGEFVEGDDIVESQLEDNLGFEYCDEVADFSDNSEDDNYVNAKV